MRRAEQLSAAVMLLYAELAAKVQLQLASQEQEVNNARRAVRYERMCVSLLNVQRKRSAGLVDVGCRM